MSFILIWEIRSRWFCAGWDLTIHSLFCVPPNPFITCWAIGSSWWHSCSHLLYFWLQKPLQILHDPDIELVQNLSDIWEQRGVRKGQKKGGKIEEKNALVQTEKLSYLWPWLKYFCTSKTCWRTCRISYFSLLIHCEQFPVYEMDSC